MDSISGVTWRDEPVDNDALLAELDAIVQSPARNRREHPVVLGIESGELSREQIAGWVYQITCWANPSNIIIGQLYARAPDDDLRQLLLENLMEEEHGSASGAGGHVTLFEQTLDELGWDADRRAREEVKQETWAFAHWLEIVMSQRPFAEGIAAVSFAAERTNPFCFARVETGLRENYGISEQGLQSIAVHASHVEQEHGSLGPDSFARYATTAKDQNAVRFSVAHTCDLYYRQWMTYQYY